MKTITVKLDTAEKVKEFVNAVQHLDADLDLSHGRHVIDAKSIMGIFSLSLSNALSLVVYDDDKFDKVKAAVSKFAA